MADSARLTHVSPGIYSREIEITHAVKSLGITTLGLVGETKKGPAFQPTLVENWRDFTNTFGGTSAEKFVGSQYPKYELPYIAKSYLTQSNQMQVCRVLGLSGYNAGPAWVVTAHGTGKYADMAVAVIRSKGYYANYVKHDGTSTSGDCECASKSYDVLTYYVGETKVADCSNPKQFNMDAIKLTPYTSLNDERLQCSTYQYKKGDNNEGEGYFTATLVDNGRFTISGFTGTDPDNTDNQFSYAVSLNPGDTDYILKVLGTSPSDGDAPLYVESLYDIAYLQGIEVGDIDGINAELVKYAPYTKSDYSVLDPVYGFLEKDEAALTRRDVGKRFLADGLSQELSATCHSIDYTTRKVSEDTEEVEIGQVYTVRQHTDASGKRHYYYTYYVNVTEEDASEKAHAEDRLSETEPKSVLVENNADGKYYRLMDGNVVAVTCDLNNYKSAYRFASTPWFVSNVKGDANKIELNTMFRFHTISDGNCANEEIKVSIANVKPEEGLFDVIIRAIDDTDASPLMLERFSKCSMNPNTKNFIGYKIGSYDGAYEPKSKYVTVEINDSTAVRNSVPCGFMGYPLANFSGVQIVGEVEDKVTNPIIKYNLNYDNDKSNKKQYFGLSNSIGVDPDMFSFKGVAAYDIDTEALSNGFHLDSRLDMNAYAKEKDKPKVYVDGIEGFTFDAVACDNRTNLLEEKPIIGDEGDMMGSIYQHVDLRKFTAYFYGGFDGWDAYRTYRTNTDDFKLTTYKGNYNKYNGQGASFDRIDNFSELGLKEQGMTSDYYAFLSGVRQFANPESVDVNVFATPGVDLVNCSLLSKEIIEMLEEERADSIYVAVTPDKPFGASDYTSEMYTADEIVEELEDTEIDSNYTCTYYPWVRYADKDTNQYIYLSPTKDVVRNMAMTDNTAYPWFAPAGVSRGDVDCTRAHYITKLADEDTLYEGRINPVKTFASDGVKIWGQKNLQVADSQLNRIAVRRLLLRLRKLVAISCIGLIFEPNDATTKNKFLSTVTPIMDNIRANRGISDYKIEVNDTVESRENHELPAKIFFKPYGALEYISIDFIVTPEGVSFEDI